MHAKSLYLIIHNALTPNENIWIDHAVDSLSVSKDPLNDLLNLSVVVKRQITSPIVSSLPQLSNCDNSEIIRIFLLLTLFEQHKGLNKRTSLKQYYQAGDSAEKMAFLKGLSVLDEDGEAINIAVNAARCNSLDEFSALTLNNAYPAKHFAELNFNQLVLKALFNGLEIDNVIKLANRANTNLANMCFSYAIEQALAQRIPPASLWLVINFDQLTDENKQAFEQYTTHFYHLDNKHQLILSKLMTEKKLPQITL